MPSFSYDFAGFGVINATSVAATTVTATSLVGTLTGNSTGTHTGSAVITDAAEGLKIGGASGVNVQAPPPDSNAQFEAMTGLTSAAWWRHDRLNATGSLVSLGDVTATLASGGTPTLNAHCGSRTGIHYDGGTGDAHSADVLDAASNSFICGGRFALLTDPAGTNHQLIGRFNALIANGWTISVDDSGNIFYYFDDGPNNFAAFPAALNALMKVAGQHVDLVVQLDRSGANPVLRIRASRYGVSLGTASATLTGCGTLTGATQEFGFGAIPVGTPAYNGGAWVQWAFYASGMQAEGATKAQTVSEGLGFE